MTRLATEASQGLHPLLPGADETELQKLSEAIEEKLDIHLPPALADYPSPSRWFRRKWSLTLRRRWRVAR